MALDTYANLQTEILARLNRAGDSDAVTRCPTWITLAEDELRLALTRLMVRQGETNDTAFSIASEYTALPAGFFRFRAIKLQGSPVRELNWIPPQVADRWDTTATRTGKPKDYTIQGNQLRVFPPPDTTYTATATYYALPSLGTSQATNWLLTAHPKVYYVASIAEAYGYYDNFDKQAQMEGIRDRVLSGIYTSDGSDQQGTSMRQRVDSSTP